MSTVDKAFSHIQEEIGLANIRISIQGNYEIIQKAHDSIHELMYLAPLALPHQTGVSWLTKSAFLVYQWEAFHQAHRSLLEALAGYYNTAYVLLRSTLELIVQGAFWECMAHKNFREKASVLDKSKGKRKSVKDWIDNLIKQESSVERDLEEVSAAIFDKTAILFSDTQFQEKYVRIPSFLVMVKQLIEWQIVDIPKSLDILYDGLYRNLSKDVHVRPDETDVGRKHLSDKDWMKTEVIPGEAVQYMIVLLGVMDMAIVIELNVLKDWIELGDKVKFKDELESLRDWGLYNSVRTLESLVTMTHKEVS